MYDPLTNPPMPEWSNLRNEEREAVVQSWEMYSCPHAYHGDVLGFYEDVRKVLQARERRYAEATMHSTVELP